MELVSFSFKCLHASSQLQAHQWLLMGFQACRLLGLKHFLLKPSQRCKNASSRRQQASQGHPKATPQWLFVGWPACRLPGLKRLRPFKGLNGLKRFNASKAYQGFKPLKPSKTSKSLAASTKPSGHKPQRCSLPFACRALCC